MSVSRTAEWVLVAIVVLGALPLVVGAYQHLLVGFHRYRNHYDRCAEYFPNTVVLVPAWNEAAVLGTTIERLMALDYPRDRLRVYVVDDASTDDTPAVLAGKAAEYPGAVVHLRRERGGQGKAHTLNHGLEQALADDWTEAVLVMDADVVFTGPSLRRMARHLIDPEVGAVTAYIKEGSEPGTGLTRAISYEYAVAQAAARRAQNVVGALACLAGGAQLHSRVNLDAIGGRIDTTTLAEDTITTIETQLHGRKVVFEPNAIVWAEEPGDLDGLWKQRLRWARGNVQVTRKYWRLWFRPSSVHRLGSISFGLFWFATFLLPVFMITSSAALVGLWSMDSDLARHAFAAMWIVNGLCFIFVVAFTLMIDPGIARRVWRRALIFPGLASLTIVLASCFPAVARWIGDVAEDRTGWSFSDTGERLMILAAYLWVALSMVAAYLVLRLDQLGAKRLAAVLLWFVGYGPLLCAVTFTAYVREARHTEQVWDKTVKTGKVADRS